MSPNRTDTLGFWFLTVVLVVCLSCTGVSAQAPLSETDPEEIVLRDGIRFIQISDIDCLAADGERVWIGTSRGLYSHSANTGEFNRHGTRPVLQIEVVNGDVWAIESASLIRHLDAASGSWTSIASPDGVSGQLRSFTIDETELWAGGGTPQPARGMHLCRLNIADNTWTIYNNDGLKDRKIGHTAYPAYDYANRIHIADDHLIIFGEFGTYRFDTRTEEWRELQSESDKQEAVLSAFTPTGYPFCQRIGYHCTNSINSRSSLWFSSLGLPESYRARVLAFVAEESAVWLGTERGLIRLDRSDNTVKRITLPELAITDLDLSDDTLWVSVRDKGLLRLIADRDWGDFEPISISEVSDPPRSVVIEGLVSTHDDVPERGLWIIANWRWKKRSYYRVVGDNADEIRKHVGKIVKVSGDAVTVREFGWGGGQYELTVKEVLEVSDRPQTEMQ